MYYYYELLHKGEIKMSKINKISYGGQKKDGGHKHSTNRGRDRNQRQRDGDRRSAESRRKSR